MGGQAFGWVSVCFAFLVASPVKSQDIHEWVKEMTPTISKNLYKNISPSGAAKGTVIASPEKDNPNYFYHWVRDAGLVMDFVVSQYEHTSSLAEKRELYHRIIDFVEFSKLNQLTPNLSGGLGEPRFNVDGSADNSNWGRPQNDGPAIRANALIHFANVLLKEGKEEIVRKLLYDGTSKSIIKRDLEYVALHGQDTCFDLWEEIRGHHFYSSMVIRRALKQGADLAKRLNDSTAGELYAQRAKEIETLIHRHWDDSKGYLNSTIDRNGGADYKKSNLDSSIILAALHGDAGDHFYDVTSDRVVATLLRLEQVFRQVYPINQKGYRGTAIGRYPEDRYDGLSTSGQGNPWFITTNIFAQFYYELAREVRREGKIHITSLNKTFYSSLANQSLILDSANNIDQANKDQIVEGLIGKGDDYMACTQFHMGPSGNISEQMNRYTGFMQGARDLTWSYASFLTAAVSRLGWK